MGVFKGLQTFCAIIVPWLLGLGGEGEFFEVGDGTVAQR